MYKVFKYDLLFLFPSLDSKNMILYINPYKREVFTLSAYIENLKSRGWDNFIVDIGNEFRHIREELSITQSITTVVSSQPIVTIDSNNIKTKTDIQSEESIKSELEKVREELNINSFSL